MRVVAITGASGYVGKHLLVELLKINHLRIKVLSRVSQGQSDPNNIWPTGVEVIQGDLLNKESLKDFFEEGCTVIHLAYLWHAGEAGNLTATRNLIETAAQAKVARLIHCSTAIVVGSVEDKYITELTPCKPATNYERTKLKIEHEILSGAEGNFDIAILRPTSVFGPGSIQLKKMASDLIDGSRVMNYVKSCFLGKRQMNLVCINNLIAAILFMGNQKGKVNGEIFLVSDDASPTNNYGCIEKVLINRLSGKQHRMPPIHIPYFVLNFILRIFGKPMIKPSASYMQDKLLAFGYQRKVNFEDGLLEYADWLHSILRAKTPESKGN